MIVPAHPLRGTAAVPCMFFSNAAPPPATMLPAGRTAAPGDSITRTSGGTVVWLHDSTGDVEHIVTGTQIATVTGDIQASTQHGMQVTAASAMSVTAPSTSASGNVVIGTGMTGTFTDATGQIVSLMNGVPVVLARPGGSAPLVNTAFFDNLTAQVNALDVCSELQALADEAMAALQAQITAIEQQIAALLPVITIPEANLGAIITWITNFVAPYIAASEAYAAQAAQMATSIAALASAIENAASRITHCTVTVPSIVTP